MGYRSLLLILILVFGLLFSFFYVSLITPEQPKVVTVIIPEGASLESSARNNFEPATILVVIGVNNTVRWINHDVTGGFVVAFDKNDPDFYEATSDKAGRPKAWLGPGDTFEFTFTKPGEFEYGSVPHPHKRGVVIVLASEI